MIIHVDMDAFFASVEQLDNPDFVGKPVIVGGTSNRGVVAASSYEARKFGVYSAMPIFQAKQKCPPGVFIRPRGNRYKEVSVQVMSILSTFTPVIQQVSIDEAFMDISGCESIFGSPYEIGVKIKQKVKQNIGLTCSVGIAPLKFLAKIASDMDKPDGLTYIAPNEAATFINTLPVKKISGVGQRTAAHLEKMGIFTLGDVNRYTREKLAATLGKFGNRIFELANGFDRSGVDVHRPVKSISTEETLAADIKDFVLLKKYLLKHSEDVGRQLRKKGRKAGTVTLKIKHSDFKQVTRQTKLFRYTFSSGKIYQAAVQLLENYPLTKPVRLIGVGVSDLDDRQQLLQMDLFSNSGDGVEKWEKVDTAVDAIAEKFGKDVITKAGLAGDE
ncbi:MAG: DNA polymerase IV [Desulfobacteraceae bacterium]|nr:DNA polymerase IV [Desulfobacteraceae bacterium]MBC2754259.1 DNA polymerase IV [Desulfobacteraceae bacterium]